MLINVRVKTDFRKRISKKMLMDTANAVFALVGGNQEQEITIVIQDDAFIQKLNFDYLGINEPTDVLSFSTNEVDPETNRNYLGDIIISLPRAAEQADKAGHPVDEELKLLILHGILHLLGYDHSSASSQKRMWKIQQELIEKIGIKINQLPDN